MIPGLAGAFFTAKRDFPLKKLLLSLQAVPLCIPALLAALGYVGAFGMNGKFNILLIKLFHLQSAPLTFLYTFSGLVFVQGWYNFPIIMKNVSDAWEKASTNTENAARLLGASEKRIFFSITLNKILPAICSSAMIVFLFCFFSFIIVLLFAPPLFSTLETELYQRARTFTEPGRASIIALTESLTALIAVSLFTMAEKKCEKERDIENKHTVLKNIGKTSTFEKILFSVYIIAITMCFIVPFCMIFANLTPERFLWVLRRKTFLSSLKNSLLTGLATAFFSSVIGFILSVIFFRKNKKTGAKIISFIPLTLSSIVLGFIFLTIFRRANLLILIICQVILYWPYAFRICISSLEKIPTPLLNQSRLLLDGNVSRFFRFFVPLEKRAFFSSFFFCFAMSIGDASLPLVLAIPKYTNIALDTMKLAGAYRFSEASASGLILFMLALTAYLLRNFTGEKSESRKKL